MSWEPHLHVTLSTLATPLTLLTLLGSKYLEHSKRHAEGIVKNLQSNCILASAKSSKHELRSYCIDNTFCMHFATLNKLQSQQCEAIAAQRKAVRITPDGHTDLLSMWPVCIYPQKIAIRISFHCLEVQK